MSDKTSGNERYAAWGDWVTWPAARPCCRVVLELKSVGGMNDSEVAFDDFDDFGPRYGPAFVTAATLDWLDPHVYAETPT